MPDVPYRVIDYLLDRLVELSVGRIFGVPGDFTLGMLDHVVRHPGLTWTGCTNELNAGYAADGYGRLHGIAALMTTFGVGELSAVNALAGSYAEHVPVVHIVGAPSSGAQAAQRIVHHSLGDGIFTHFLEMHASITCARAALTEHDAVGQIDRVLRAVRDQRLPGYLLVPADVAELPVDPPSVPLPPTGDVTDPLALAAFTEAADRLLQESGRAGDTVVLAGLLVHRFDAVPALQSLLAAGPLAHATSMWAKSVVDETNPRYLGIYSGAASTDAVRRAVEDAPVLVVAGVQFTDLNSGFFSQQLPRSRTIELGAAVASVGTVTFGPISITRAMEQLAARVAARRGPAAPAVDPLEPPPTHQSFADEDLLSQESLWQSVGEALRPGDLVLADQGTSFYGMATRRLPRGVTFIGQPLWASIGYTLPALLGACLAEPHRRGVLLVGDGAAQLTIQELSSLLREGLSPLVVVVDNDGYTVERAIHGEQQPYNDIARWDWCALPAALAPHRMSNTRKVTTVGELRDALQLAQTAPHQLTLIQAVVPRMDVPDLLTVLAAAAAAANAPVPRP